MLLFFSVTIMEEERKKQSKEKRQAKIMAATDRDTLKTHKTFSGKKEGNCRKPSCYKCGNLGTFCRDFLKPPPGPFLY
jgi:hypothetical protein